MNRTNNSELYERVTTAGKFFGGLPAFAEMIGVQYRTFHAYLSAKRQHNLWPLLPTMLEAFPRLSRQWLYFGEGPMLIGHGTPLDRPVPLQEIAAAAEAMAAEAGGTWGDVLTYIVDAARAEGGKREPVADSRQIQESQEKLLAAHRAGIDTVLIPKENLKDLEEVPANVREALTIIPAEDVHTVLETALCEKPTPKQQA